VGWGGILNKGLYIGTSTGKMIYYDLSEKKENYSA